MDEALSAVVALAIVGACVWFVHGRREEGPFVFRRSFRVLRAMRHLREAAREALRERI